MDQPRTRRLKRRRRHAPVVVLNKLPDHQLAAVAPSTRRQVHSGAESPGSSDPDMTCEAENHSSDSDFLPENYKPKDTKSSRRKKMTNKEATTKKPRAAQKPSAAKMNKNKAGTNSPQMVSPVGSRGSEETTTASPGLPEVEVKLDMEVLARRRPMRWLRGKIIEMVEKDGRLKYKVRFDEMGRSLVSGHHLAFPSAPKLAALHVGVRVVVQSPDDVLQFQPGVLAELPCRKNLFRFLVFLDDHTPMYVGLPALHLICKPLENPFDDIPDGPHKDFLKQYVKSWPYPHVTQYKVGQCVRAEEGETMQTCEVTTVDGSLIEVVFQESQQKQWIFRGSIKLENMAKFLALKQQQEEKNNWKQ